MSTTPKDGGPAFPAAVAMTAGDQVVVNPYAQRGISARDFFASQAMAAILGTLAQGIRPTDVPMLAKDSYRIADAMLTERTQ